MQKVNDGETPNEEQFLENLHETVEDSSVGRFFDSDYIQALAESATKLEKDSTLRQPGLLPKVTDITLYQQVIYCDDSSSMHHGDRWDAQVQLVNRITRITTRILPEGDGVALRFINQDTDNSDKLNFRQIGDIMKTKSWDEEGNTQIGTHLRSKILEPLVYSKLQPPTLKRPLLISVITDGIPTAEKVGTLVEAIRECGVELEQAGYPRESVKFMIGQVGTSEKAKTFLKGVNSDDNKDIKDMMFVTSDQLDERWSALKGNERDLDRWLIELLFEPIKNVRSK